VSGLFAANTLLDRLAPALPATASTGQSGSDGDGNSNSSSKGVRSKRHPILAVRADEPQVRWARTLNRGVAKALDPFGILTRMLVR
jgi:hypothetical protein